LRPQTLKHADVIEVGKTANPWYDGFTFSVAEEVEAKCKFR